MLVYSLKAGFSSDFIGKKGNYSLASGGFGEKICLPKFCSF